VQVDALEDPAAQAALTWSPSAPDWPRSKAAPQPPAKKTMS
jgi:hypothetical protein